MVKMKSFKGFNNPNAYTPSDADYQHVYTQRSKGKTDRRIVMGDNDIPPLGLSKWSSFRKHFDSEQAKSRPEYHPSAEDNRSGLTDEHFKRIFKMREAGTSETDIHATGIHKDTVAKYIDSDAAKTRPDYHPPLRKRK